MSEICAGLGAGSTHPQVRTFWNLAAAMFEAQHHGLLGFDVFTKRVASRLLAQLRLLQRGDSDVSERLARDVLFFCAQAGAGRARHPRAAPDRGVRDAYGFVDAGADRLLAQRPRPLRSGDRRPRQEARRRGEGSLVGDGRRRDAPPRRPLRAVRAGRRFAAAPVPVRRDVRRRAAERGAADAGGAGRAAGAAGDGGRDQPALPRGRARRRRLRPARARRARQAPRRAALAACARSSRPSRSSRGWRSSTGASPTGRRWAASSRSCARRSPRSRRRSTSSSATPADTAVLHEVPVAARLDARRAVGARHGRRVAGAAQDARRGRRPGLDRGRSRAGRSRPASSSAWPATCPRSAS